LGITPYFGRLNSLSFSASLHIALQQAFRHYPVPAMTSGGVETRLDKIIGTITPHEGMSE